MVVAEGKESKQLSYWEYGLRAQGPVRGDRLEWVFAKDWGIVYEVGATGEDYSDLHALPWPGPLSAQESPGQVGE